MASNINRHQNLSPAASTPNQTGNQSRLNVHPTASAASVRSKKRPPVKPKASDGCCSRFMDNISYRWIRFKVYFCAHKKADELDTLTYDPYTGEPVLTGSEKPKYEVEEERETEVKCLAYSAELHNSLKYFWWSINFTGRLPFRIRMEDLDLGDGVVDTLIIRLNNWSAWVVNIGTCLALWILFIWAAIGHVYICIDKVRPGEVLSLNQTTTTPDPRLSSTNSSNNSKPFEERTPGQLKEIAKLETHLPEFLMLKRYWLDVWFFYTTLFHLASVTTNQCIYGRDYALFFKRWYKALDRSKVKVHASLRGFYLKLTLLGVLLVILMVCLFAAQEKFSFMYRTCQVILAGYMYPIVRVGGPKTRNYADGELYFQNPGLTVGVFVLYCWIVLVAWQNSIIHLTFSRCFRNGIRLLNDRVCMVLLPLEVPAIGPNAVRITAVHVQADYAHLTAAGMAQNKVFGFALMSDMMWTLLTLFFEIIVLTFYGIQDPAGPEYVYRFTRTYKGTNIKQMDPALPYIINSVGHAAITLLRLWIVVWFPDLVFREAQLGYRAVTSKGLLSCSNRLQRNFVRSLWLMTVPKFPIIITANNYFKLTRGMICALCAAVATFYIFAMQARADMRRILLGKWELNIIQLYEKTNNKSFHGKDN